MSLLGLPSFISLIVEVALLAVKLFALIDALRYPADAYRAAGKWTKQGWVILLAVAVVLQLAPGLVPLALVGLALTIAAFVYLADVRPALSSLRRR
jgi:hypothetical protein